MPSGAKKRKAAKRKKEKEEANNNNNSASIDTTNVQGNEDRKAHDERASDGGEVGSPSSQDHQNQQHSFDEGNDEFEKTDSSAVQSVEAGQKSVEVLTVDADDKQKVNVDDDSVVKVERELNSEQNEQVKDVGIESTKEPCDDNESLSLEKKDEEDAATGCDNGKEVVDEITQISENGKPNHKDGNIPVIETDMSVGLDTPAVPIPVSEVVEGVKGSIQVESPKIPVESGLMKHENRSLLNDKVSEEVKSVDGSGDSEAIVVTEKHTDKDSPVVDEKIMSFVSGNKEKILTLFTGHSVETSIPVETTQEHEPSDVYANGIRKRTFTTSDDHSAETGKHEEQAKDIATSESNEKQPLATSAPQVAERTSWISCCGLFDVFTGSSR